MNAEKKSVCSNGARVITGDVKEAEEGSPGSLWFCLSCNPQVLLTWNR